MAEGDELIGFFVERLNDGGVLVTQTRRGDIARGAALRRGFGGHSDRRALNEYLMTLVHDVYSDRGVEEAVGVVSHE